MIYAAGKKVMIISNSIINSTAFIGWSSTDSKTF